MSNVKVYNGTCISSPTKATKNKPAVEGRPYTMMFIRPSEMPPEWTGVRVKGTGKTPVLPEGMELVWSLTHDGFRCFNHNTQVDALTISDALADVVDHLGIMHRQQILTSVQMMQAYRPDLYEATLAGQTAA